MTPYDVRLSRPAARSFERLPPDDRRRIRQALNDLAARAVRPGWRGGRAVKTIRGLADEFDRLRVGDYRVMYEVISADNVILVLGIVHRRDLERWLRSR